MTWRRQAGVRPATRGSSLKPALVRARLCVRGKLKSPLLLREQTTCASPLYVLHYAPCDFAHFKSRGLRPMLRQV
jgi:hypothetical protein